MTEAVFKSKEALRLFDDITSKTKDIEEKRRGIIGLFSAIVYRDIIDHFEKQEGPSGPWQQWSKIYRDLMAARGRSQNKILQDTGRLRQSFRPTNFRTNPAAITWFNPARTSKGYPYAAAHDLGLDGYPQREFMWLSPKALKDIESTVLEYITK